MSQFNLTIVNKNIFYGFLILSNFLALHKFETRWRASMRSLRSSTLSTLTLTFRFAKCNFGCYPAMASFYVCPAQSLKMMTTRDQRQIKTVIICLWLKQLINDRIARWRNILAWWCVALRCDRINWQLSNSNRLNINQMKVKYLSNGFSYSISLISSSSSFNVWIFLFLSNFGEIFCEWLIKIKETTTISLFISRL